MDNSSIHIHLTAFGKFGKILENPTSILVNSITDDEMKEFNIKSK